jgi:hypothetical protein
VTAARLASGTFAAGLSPGFSAGGDGATNTGNVFTSLGSSTHYGTIAQAELNTIVRTNFIGSSRPDYNHDGFVDMADYVLWRNAAGQSGAGLAADGNGDGVVNHVDYVLWRANVGGGEGMAAGTGLLFTSHWDESMAIPEPTSGVMLTIGATLWLAYWGGRASVDRFLPAGKRERSICSVTRSSLGLAHGKGVPND